MTVKELKEECREKGLRISGTKKELIDRLKDPTTDDITPTKQSNGYVTIGIEMVDSKKLRPQIGSLVMKGFATFAYYSFDKHYYHVNKEKWYELLKTQKK
jgi:hypothetical protein